MTKKRTRTGLFILLCCLAPLTWAQPCKPPPVMLPMVYHGGVDVAQFWISEKLDGVRGRWDGEKLCTRGGHRIHAPAWFTAGWPAIALDGELWIGRGRFSETSSVVLDETPNDAEWHQVHFMVFDLPEDGGPFDRRVARMRTLLDDPAIAWLRPIRQFRLATVAQLDAKLKAVVAKGGEGLVLHRHDAYYHPGRSHKLLKYKLYQDDEARVVGYNPGHGKYHGMMGSVIVERPDGLQFSIGSGFSDAQRAKPPAIGTWITYRYNGLTRHGVPRFARFLHVRKALPPPDPQ